MQRDFPLPHSIDFKRMRRGPTRYRVRQGELSSKPAYTTNKRESTKEDIYGYSKTYNSLTGVSFTGQLFAATNPKVIKSPYCPFYQLLLMERSITQQAVSPDVRGCRFEFTERVLRSIIGLYHLLFNDSLSLKPSETDPSDRRRTWFGWIYAICND